MLLNPEESLFWTCEVHYTSRGEINPLYSRMFNKHKRVQYYVFLYSLFQI